MLRNQRFFSERLALVLIGIMLFASLTACYKREIRDIDVTSKTTYSGTINGSPWESEVVATFNTGRGGTSTCKFTKIPSGFNPASLGTHA